MEDDSRGGHDNGRTLWSGLKAVLGLGESDSTVRDEIEEVIERSEGDAPRPGDLTDAERVMLRNLLHFGDKTAGDVAVPRGEIIAVPSTIAFDELLVALREAEHSRLPVYEGSLDTVIGMIHIKDIFLYQGAGKPPPDDIRSLMRTPLYVPESMGMLDLLARMRAGRVHLAIVVDEFGGTEGLLTIEDVVEEIVGEIEDEHDEELPGLLIPLDGGLWDADARAELDDVAETIDPRLAVVDEDVDTLGGLAFVLAGRIPEAGTILHHPSGWRLEITAADTRRVTRLRLHPPEEGEGEE